MAQETKRKSDWFALKWKEKFCLITFYVDLKTTPLYAHFKSRLYQMDIERAICVSARTHTHTHTLCVHIRVNLAQTKSHRWCKFTTANWVFSWQSGPERLEIIAATQSLLNPVIGRGDLGNKQTTETHTSLPALMAPRKQLLVGSSVCLGEQRACWSRRRCQSRMYIVIIEMEMERDLHPCLFGSARWKRQVYISTQVFALSRCKFHKGH